MKKKFILACFVFLILTICLHSQVLGDVNSDSVINNTDALLIAQYYVGLSPQGFVAGNADLDCSGTINIIDALLAAKYYAGLITQFPCQGATSDLFCKFRWGMNNGSGTAPVNLDLMSIWVGYETDDLMNNAVKTMLTDLKAKTTVTPVYYAYFIAFKANILDELGDCNTDLDGHNLCNDGAQWIRDNRSYIMTVYDTYARLTVEIWGTTRPLIWLIEPDFIQYTYAEQTNPLTLAEIGVLATDIINVVKARMPNAVISLFHATWTYGVANYWSYFNLSRVDMINTTGMADQDGYFNDGDAANRAEATYSFLHSVTGKPILVDTSFGVTNQDNTWSNATAATLNARISEGVFAVIIEPVPTNYEAQITALNPLLISPCH